MKVAILYSNFFDHYANQQMVGGIETYLLNLARVFQAMGIEPTIYQWSQKPFLEETEGIMVKGISIMHLPYKKRPSALFQSVVAEIDPDQDVIVFGSDQQSVQSNFKRVISIQHGISWDLPTRFLTNHAVCHAGLAGFVYKAWIRRGVIAHYERCANRVCVDYNFLNWYKTYSAVGPSGRNWVIPNFTAIASAEQISARASKGQTFKVLFARRFCEFRGTRIMAEAARSILTSHSNVEFTFAGEGPDEAWLKDRFVGESRVKFIKYFRDEALEIHLQHHIAIIPSLGSEGTSLSVAEAMGASCAVVATAIGGITNMIVDGYNGLLILPNVSELTSALERLIEKPSLIRHLGANAHDVASRSFALDIWQARWRQVIQEIVNE